MIKAFRNDGNAFIVMEGASMRTMRLHRDVMAGADNRDSDIRRNPMSGWIPIFRESDNRLDSDNPGFATPGYKHWDSWRSPIVFCESDNRLDSDNPGFATPGYKHWDSWRSPIVFC